MNFLNVCYINTQDHHLCVGVEQKKLRVFECQRWYNISQKSVTVFISSEIKHIQWNFSCNNASGLFLPKAHKAEPPDMDTT